MHIPGQRGGAAIAADFRGSQRIGLVVRAEAAVLSGDGDAEQAGMVQVAIILSREFRFAVIGRGASREHRLAELARARDDFGLFVVEAERVRIEDRRVQNDSVDRCRSLVDLYRHQAVTRVAAT